MKIDYDRMLPRQIAVIQRYQRVILTELLEEYDISYGQVLFFLVVADHPGMTQDDVVQLLKISKSSGTKVVQKLEKSGLIIAKVVKGKRSKVLKASKKGNDFAGTCNARFIEYQKILSAGLKKAEKETLYKLLTVMVDNVIEYAEQDYRDFYEENKNVNI